MNSNTEEFGNLLSTIYIYQLMGELEWVNPNCETEVGKKLQKFRDKPWENEKCGAENMDFFLMESSYFFVVYISTV